MSEIGPEMVVRVPKGWLCPVCGRVYAPVVMECLHCGKDGGPHPSRPSVDPPSPTRSKSFMAKRSKFFGTTGEGFGECGEWVDVLRTCGKCGGRMQWHKDNILTSLPAKCEYRCKACGNVEYEEIGTAKPAYQITLNGNTVM